MHRYQLKMSSWSLFFQIRLFFAGFRVFVLQHCQAIKNYNQNRLIVKSRTGKWKEVNKQILNKIQVSAIFEMLYIHRNDLPKSKELCMETPGVFVSISMGTNMAAVNQQEHLLLSFGTEAWINLSGNSVALLSGSKNF